MSNALRNKKKPLTVMGYSQNELASIEKISKQRKKTESLNSETHITSGRFIT